MTPNPQIATVPGRASILARIAPAFSYALPAFGAAISALMLINVFQAMRACKRVYSAARILRSKRSWAPIMILLMIEAAMIAMTVLFHLRNSWLWVQYERS